MRADISLQLRVNRFVQWKKLKAKKLVRILKYNIRKQTLFFH